jgi:Uma2 family endonuclease
MTAIPLQRDVEYPESDGKPLGETEWHVWEAFDLIGAIKDHFRDTADAYVNSNLFLYYERGNPRAVICPDVFVVRGVPKHERRIYKLWEEGRPPSLVIEITSDSTRDEDLRKKKDCYERLGVEEYFLSDPLGEYLNPPLQGFRLAAGKYRRIEPGPDGALESRTLGLKLHREGKRIRLTDAATGEPLLRSLEARAQAREEEEARREAEARLRAAEEEIARLRREIGRGRDSPWKAP